MSQQSAPRDAAEAARAAFASVEGKPFPDDIFTAPQLTWAVIGCGVIANQMASTLKLAGRKLAGIYNRTHEKARSLLPRSTAWPACTIRSRSFAPTPLSTRCISPRRTIPILRTCVPHFLPASTCCARRRSLSIRRSSTKRARSPMEHGVQLIDATTILHMPLYRELIRRAEKDEFGNMSIAQVSFGSYKDFDPENRFYNPRLAGGAMLDIGVYALTMARMFMLSQPEDVVSIANACNTGVDVTSGIVMRNPDMQMAVISLTLHSKQPKRAVLSFENCYIEVMDYPRADRATIVWTATGEREEVHVGEEAAPLLPTR